MLAALEHLEQRGFILNESGVWTLCIPLHKMALEVPDGLRDMIGAQIDNLDPEVQQILEAASVNGVRFSVAVSNAVASADEERFEQICEDLSRRDRLLRAIGAGRFPDGTMSSRTTNFLMRSIPRSLVSSPAAGPPRENASADRRPAGAAILSNREDTVAAELAEHFEYASELVARLEIPMRRRRKCPPPFCQSRSRRHPPAGAQTVRAPP